MLEGPFGGFLLSPPLGEALPQVKAAVRYRSRLTDRVREMETLDVFELATLVGYYATLVLQMRVLRVDG